MTRQHRIWIFVALGILLSACSGPTAPTPSANKNPTPDTPRKSGTIRFSIQGAANVTDVPWLMALDLLKEQGYTIEQVSLSSADLITAALIRGDIDVGSASTNFTWTAIAKGAGIRTIVGRANMTYILVARQNILTCRDLNDKTLAFSSRQAVGYIMYEKYLAQNCPGVVPKIILMSESKNRVAALIANEVDGAYLEVEDWVNLQRQSPGKFHVLIDFAKEFPEIQYSIYSMRQEWAQQHPEAVKDYIAALITSDRQVMSNPQALQDGIVKYLSLDPTRAQELGAAYIAAGTWDLNGGLNNNNLQKTLDFMVSSGSVPPNIPVEKVADLTYLNAVLDRIGRK